jgi:hypothetical protein
VDLLLRLANAKTLLVLAAAIGGLGLALRMAPATLRWIHERRYPPQKTANPAGDAILQELAEKDRVKILALHRTVLEELAQAKAAGFDIADLETRAEAAAKLNAPDTRALAQRRLNEIRRDIPIKDSESASSPVAPGGPR